MRSKVFIWPGKGQRNSPLIRSGLPTGLIPLLLAGLAVAGFRLGVWFECGRGGVNGARPLAE